MFDKDDLEQSQRNIFKGILIALPFCILFWVLVIWAILKYSVNN